MWRISESNRSFFIKINPFISCIIKMRNSKATFSTYLIILLQKGGVPAAPSGTATLLRLSPSY